MPQIKLLDGKKIEFKKFITGFDLTKKISKSLEQSAFIMEVDGKLVVFITLILGFFTQIFAGVGALISMVPWIGPFIIKIFTIPSSWRFIIMIPPTTPNHIPTTSFFIILLLINDIIKIVHNGLRVVTRTPPDPASP